MIYLDSSVALALVLSEQRQPPDGFWGQRLAASRLLQFEVWNRLSAYGSDERRDSAARQLLERVDYVEMTVQALARALSPFKVPVRTLDCLHLATMHYLGERGASVTLASYDARLLSSAKAMGFETVSP